MKKLNPNKLSVLKKTKYIFYFLSLGKFILLPFAYLIRFLRKEKISYLIADGFLVGDVVMSRALCKSISLYSSNIAYLGNSQSKLILEDIPMKRIEYKWPWASYDYSLRNLFELLKTLFKIFFLQPEYIIELRGDFRSLFCLYLTCSKLIGFNFSDGNFFLNREIYSETQIHQADYNKLICENLKIDYDENFGHRNKVLSNRRQKKIGLSFSGSQRLKILPASLGLHILEFLSDKNIELVYFDFKEEPFLQSIKSESKQFQLQRLNTFSFESYFSEIQNIDYYIGMDSAGGHLASMFGIPSLIFFGTNESNFVHPKGNANLIILEIDEKLSCRPCIGVDCSNPIFQYCLTGIPKSKIESAITKLLSL